MARKKSATLTDAELRLMEVLWDRGECTVGDAVGALRAIPLAYSSVLTTMRILEQKGYVSHRKSGRAFVYYPLMDRAGARSNALNHVVRRFFNDSRELLLMKLIREEDISVQELKRLKKKIEEGEE
jgi:predicted transcriptional regulator